MEKRCSALCGPCVSNMSAEDTKGLLLQPQGSSKARAPRSRSPAIPAGPARARCALACAFACLPRAPCHLPASET
ncbi:unnamed protein product [Lota lota]